MLGIIKTNIYLMKKVSLISLNRNEVSSLLCTTKCHCWLLRAASSGPMWITGWGGGRNTSGLTQRDRGQTAQIW